MKIKYLSILLAAAFAAFSCGEKIEPESGGGEGGQTDKPEIKTYASQIYKQNSEGYNTFRIPAMVTSKKGTLLCFCEGRDSYNDYGNIDIIVKRSTDQGKTWSPLKVIADAGNDRYGNPVPVVLDSGRIIIVFGWSVNSSSTSTKVFYCISDDDGVTWGSPVEITDQVKVSSRTKYQTGPVHGIVKQRDPYKGRIVIPVYGTSSNGKPAGIFYSDDNGLNWHPGGSVDYSLGGEPTVAERGDGSLVINMRDNNAEDIHRYQSVSTDGGNSWGKISVTDLIEPSCQAAILTYDLGTTANNTVLLFSNPNHTTSRRHGSVKMSTNGGISWKYMYQYTTDTGYDMYSSYSDLTVVGDDVIGIAFERGNTNRQGIHFKSIHIDEIKEIYTGQNKN